MRFWLKCAGAVVVAFTMFALTSPNNTAQAAEEAAVFPASYRCGTGLPGAPTLSVQLLVTTENGMVSGVGRLTQAVSPPLNLQVHLDGHYTKVDDDGEVVVTLFGGRPGGVVQAVLILPDGWGKPGKSDFKWYANNRFGDSGGTVPAAPWKSRR